MDINNGFKQLYSNTSKLNSYNEYQTLNNKKDKTVDDLTKMISLLKEANVNGDDFVNSNDKKVLDKEINDAHNSKNKNSIYDFDGDEKLTIKDLVAYSTEADIDGDGSVSDEEKAFLQTEQKNLINQLKSVADNIEFDVNGDGKVDKSDVAEFLNLTSNTDFRNADKNDLVANYLKSFQNNLNLKTLDSDSNKGINLADLAHYNELLNQTQEYIDGKLDKYLSDSYANKNLDINGDGKIDKSDVNIFQAAVKSIEMQVGKTVKEIVATDSNAQTASEKLTEATDNKKEKTTSYNNAKTENNVAKSTENKAKSALNTAISKQTSAAKTLDTANKNLETAQKNYDTAKSEYEKIQAEYNEATTAADKNKLQSKLNTALAKYAKAESNLEAAKTKQKTAQDTKDKADSDVSVKQSEYNSAVEIATAKKNALDEALKAYNEALSKYNNAVADNNNAKKAKSQNSLFFNTSAKKDTAMSNDILKAKRAAVNNANAEYNVAKQAETKAKNALNAAKTKQTNAAKNLDTANKNLETAQKNYDEAKSEYEKILAQYNSATTAADKVKLQSKLSLALTKFASAESKLSIAKTKQQTAQNAKDKADAEVSAKQAEYDSALANTSSKSARLADVKSDTGL